MSTPSALEVLGSRTRTFLKDNQGNILTATALIGLCSTIYLTASATVKATHELEAAQAEYERDFTRKEKVERVWKYYLPAIGSGLATGISILYLRYSSAKQIAALGSLYTISQAALVDYKDAVVNVVGKSKSEDISSEAARTAVAKTLPESREVVIVGTGDVLCYDSITGRYFQSSMEDIRRAVNDVNASILAGCYASLSDFYVQLGLDPTAYSDEVGWDTDGLLEVEFSTVMSPDDKPCIHIGYKNLPVRDFDRFI